MNFLFFAVPGVIAALAFLFVPLTAKQGGPPAAQGERDDSKDGPASEDTVAVR
jgi:MFS transporter, AAHS family, benzoate transport protein